MEPTGKHVSVSGVRFGLRKQFQGEWAKKGKFEESIEEEFKRLLAEVHALDPGSTSGVTRTGCSISQRFKGIRRGCLSFYGIIRRV